MRPAVAAMLDTGSIIRDQWVNRKKWQKDGRGHN
jgi:hypothetical protein